MSDRKLYPLYDACDSGNHKLAIQIADKLLKRTPYWPCCTVLKSIALNRLGRTSEALSAMESLENDTITDESALSAAILLYKEMNKVEKIVPMYEKAFKAKPDDDEFGNHLFMALVRVKDFKKQQQVAFQLSKSFGDNKYYFWGVMALVLQVHKARKEGGEDKSIEMFLMLASRYMEKAHKDGKITDGEAFDLYLQVLSLQGRHKDAAELAEGPLGKECMKDNIERLRLQASLAGQAEMWTRQNELHRGLINRNPDDWGSIKAYLGAVFRTRSANETGSGDSLEDAYSFITTIATDEMTKTIPRRGPFMGEIEFVTQCVTKNIIPSNAVSLPTPRELLVAYYKRFGTKYCCLADMSVYTHCIPINEAQDFINDLAEVADLDLNTLLVSDHKALQQLICICQLRRRLGLDSQSTVKDKMIWAGRLVEVYTNTIKYGKDLKETEIQYSDNILILAVQYIIDAARETGDDSYLRVAIATLQHGLVASKKNFHMKLILICLARYLGNVNLSKRMYDQMDIKYIQLDTLSHLLDQSPYMSANFPLSKSQDIDIAGFFRSNNRETSEATITAYKYGTFSKIYEFVQFKERLDTSIVQAYSETNRIYVNLLMVSDVESAFSNVAQNPAPPVDDTTINSYRDNRDFDVLRSLNNPINVKEEEVSKTASRAFRLWLRQRNMQIGCMMATRQGAMDAFKASLEAFNTALKEAMEDPSTTCKMEVISPACSFIPSYQPIGVRLGRILTPFVLLANPTVEDDLANTVKLALAEAHSALKECIVAANITTSPRLLTDLATKVFLVEILNFVALATQHHSETRNIFKKKKNKEVEAVNQEIKQWVSQLRTLMNDVGGQLEVLAKELTLLPLPTDLPPSIIVFT
eukprot:Ihof_evm6s230 gene=Ihof_evmTU6s230